jgi:DNA uptake protein ComE-like DNA-binding protein
MMVGDTRLKTQDSRLKTTGRKYQPGVWSLKSSSGMALITVMWIVTILTVLASEFLYSMRLEVRIARNWSDQTSAFYAAKGGLERAITTLRDDETDYDSLDEDWAEEIADELNNCTYSTNVIDESAKINVNTADQETLTKAIAYCMTSSGEDQIQEEIDAQAQTLATAIIEKRPYRTVAGVAKANDMTPEILYGESDATSDAEETSTEEEEETSVALVDITTAYSVDKNTTPDGTNRVNISSADANQIREGVNPEGEEIITEQEAQAIVDYRDELGNNQSDQGGGQNQPGQGGNQNQPGQAGGQDQQTGYTGIGQLLDVPAISQGTFDSIRDRITVEDEENRDGDQGENRININTADAGTLQNLDGIDEGIANSIIRYREGNQFDNVDEIREVKLISIDDMKAIVDRVSISDDEVLQGKVNINSAPLEILAMLPGLDEEKAQAIIDRRTVPEGQEPAVMASQQNAQESGPFAGLGQLLDVEGIDEDTFKSLVDHVTYRSHAYRIESEGRSSDGKIVQNCIAVVDRSGNRVEIKYWKQY